VRIGEAAAQLGVSPRTLRYYEELGLLRPSSKTAGGARRYTDADVERMLRIRELQELLGFNLEEIRVVLGAEDRLAQLRDEWQEGGKSSRRRDEILDEATALNGRLRDQVQGKLGRLNSFLADIEAREIRLTEFRSEVSAAQSK
jgi:MerR family transcriptional regulator, repressor of the yfmOP operon